MGSPLLAVFSVLPLVNACAVILAGCVVGVCAFLSRYLGHIPEWMLFPPIMMSGYVPPESVIYSSGLTVVAVALFFCQTLLFLLTRAMLQRDWAPNNKNLPLRFVNICAYSFSVAGAISLLVQAVVPVQNNVLYTFFDYVDVEQNTVIHESAAACWWISEAMHWILAFIVEKRSEQLSLLRRNRRSFVVKYVFVLLALVAGGLAMVLKPTLPAPKSTVSRYFHATNFCWWFSAAAFFVAYFTQSWQSAAILDHLGIRSFVFGSLRSTRYFKVNTDEDAEAPAAKADDKDADDSQ